MASRFSSNLAALLLAGVATGCNCLTQVGAVRTGPDFEVSIPMHADAATPGSKSAPAAPPPPAPADRGGLMELMHPHIAVAKARAAGNTYGKGGGDAGATVEISKGRIQAEVNGILHAARDRQYRRAAKLLVRDAADEERLLKFFEAYFEAYFRKFDFIQGPDGTIKPGETFFYNRAGQKFGFPTVTVSVNAAASNPLEVTRIDEIALIGDLTRVALEAIGDAFSPDVPADANATGCKVKGLFDPSICVAGDVARLKQLKCIVNYADKTEAFTGSVAAQVVRGGWWAALNNEALAKAFQVALSVGFRKAAESAVMREGLCPPGHTTATVTETAKVRVLLVP